MGPHSELASMVNTDTGTMVSDLQQLLCPFGQSQRETEYLCDGSEPVVSFVCVLNHWSGPPGFKQVSLA